MERLSDFLLRVYPLDGVPFRRRLLLHIIFWVMMFAFYWIAFGFSGATVIYKILTSANYLAISIIFYYTSTYLIFSLNYSQFTNFIIAGLCFFAIYILSAGITHYRIVLIVEHNWLSATRNRMSESLFSYYHGGFLSLLKIADIVPNLAETLLTTLPAYFVKFSRVFAKNLAEKKQIEIDYLKSQINPHFLVNTLNNIYSLTVTEDERSGEAILSLSSMLNYVLYETNEHQVSLVKEIRFLRDFIELEKIRNTKRLKVSFEVEGNTHGNIVPLILIAFIENAFKHSVGDSTMASVIKIQLKILDNTLYFEVENTKPTQMSDKRKTTFGGIGLTNVKKRLTSLYNDKHTLKIKDERNLYTIYLTLLLK